MSVFICQIVLFISVVNALAYELWPEQPLAPLPKREDILAFANWPYRSSPWEPRELLPSKIGRTQMGAIDAEIRPGLRELSRQDFLRFLEKGKHYTITNNFPERALKSDWERCVEGVAFTKAGNALFWQMFNGRVLQVWDIQRRSMFYVVDSDCVLQPWNQTNSVLQAPGSDEVTGFCSGAPSCYLGQGDRERIARETLMDFLTMGKAIATKSSQPPPTQFWRAGGACLSVDTIYFFDRWDEQRMHLERQDGASCVLVKAKQGFSSGEHRSVLQQQQRRRPND